MASPHAGRPSDISLTAPIEEFWGGVATYRVGPDRVSGVNFQALPWPACWVAYWYRDHSCCAPAACWCWAYAREGRLGEIAGDGVAIIVFEDGLIGLYPLRHRRGELPLDADVLRQVRRYSRGEVTTLRGRVPESDVDDAATVEISSEAHSVWRAWDFALDRMGATHA